MKKLLALAVVILGFTAVSFGQASAVSGAATASATILNPISVAKSADLNFGNIVNISGGTVELTTAGTRNHSAGVSLPAFIGTVSVAKFSVTGEAGTAYTVSLPGTVDLANGTNHMTVGTFTQSAVTGTIGTLTGAAGTTTVQDILVGATLTVGAIQAPGVYTNNTTLKMTVNYN